MFLRIQNVAPKHLVGKSMRMTLAGNRTGELWQSFMKQRSLVQNRVDSNYISLQSSGSARAEDLFNPQTEFVKWAVVEVSHVGEIPEGMASYHFQGGLYAVFLHKGPPTLFPQTAELIFGQWLPNSEYELDGREHFELLDERYKNNDPTSEEELFVPIKPKRGR